MNVRKIGEVVRDAWLIVGITLLMFCLLESGLTLVFSISDRQSTGDRRARADTYSDPTWVSRYFGEFHGSATTRWSA